MFNQQHDEIVAEDRAEHGVDPIDGVKGFVFNHNGDAEGN
jgi:hypothetical protein